MYAVVVQCVTAENEDIQSVLLYLLWVLANRLIVICKSYEQTSKRQFRRNSFKNFEICFCSISKRWENLRNAFFCILADRLIVRVDFKKIKKNYKTKQFGTVATLDSVEPANAPLFVHESVGRGDLVVRYGGVHSGQFHLIRHGPFLALRMEQPSPMQRRQ